MSNITMKDFLEAGVHFGHQTRRWNPKMKEYIYGERNGIYIIDLQKTLKQFKEAAKFISDLALEGKSLLFVGTKRQAQEAIADEAKRCGIERAHGFFLVGSPGETEEDILESFRFCARLKLDTFGFNRLCVYRGTPLWQEYIGRGLVDDARDWFKYFKCSEIDPTCLPGEVINRERTAGFRRLFIHRLLHRPIRSVQLLRRFTRFMSIRDVVYVIVKPFLGKRSGATPAETLSRAVEHGDLKDSAAALTHVADAKLEEVLAQHSADRV